MELPFLNLTLEAILTMAGIALLLLFLNFSKLELPLLLAEAGEKPR